MKTRSFQEVIEAVHFIAGDIAGEMTLHIATWTNTTEEALIESIRRRDALEPWREERSPESLTGRQYRVDMGNWTADGSTLDECGEKLLARVITTIKKSIDDSDKAAATLRERLQHLESQQKAWS